MRIKFPYEPTEACITYNTEEIGTCRKKKKTTKLLNKNRRTSLWH